MRFGSVCSGIEAASVAWEPLGWRADWFAEIEKFPSAVLAHRWPSVPNLGDMTRLPDAVANDNIVAPDVLVGGTPCQAFSVAGLRQSLNDARGKLTLSFVRLADEIDRRRATAGLDPAVIVWENVPGVLSTKDNAFGCFLAGLAGEDQPLLPPGGKWYNAGAVLGPSRAIAWRILDAQYFGVAQRRRRVFVVASARDGFDPAAVLFEFDGVRRDLAPRREAGQGAAGNAGSGAAGSHWDSLNNPHPSLNQSHNTGGIGASNQKLFSQSGAGIVPAAGCFWNGEQVTQTLDAVLHKGQTMPEKNRFPAVLQARNDNAAQAIPILEPGARTVVSTSDPRAGVGIGAEGDPMFTLQAGKQHGVAVCATGDIAHTLKAEGLDGSEDGTGRGVPTIAVHGTQDPCVGVEVAFAQGRNNGGENAVLAPAVTVALRGRDGGATAELGGEVATDLRASTGGGDKPHVLLPMAVRRLTPRECERLQGFPDDHTLVPHRGKPAADGPRYKAIGNSMAVPVMRWIGQRIDAHLRSLAADNDNDE